jgi:hypothetical protein
MIWGAQSLAGPMLVMLGFWGCVCGAAIHGIAKKPTLWATRARPASETPSVWERLSVHLIVVGVWALFFGIFVWRGPAIEAWDVRLPGEARWPIWSMAEWIYVCGYVTPLVVAWVAPTRGGLRLFCVRLAGVSAVSGLCFWLLPIVSLPRAWTDGAGGVTARLLALDLGRADFGAVSFPSFHVFWAMLIAGAVAERGRGWRRAGYIWVIAMSIACVLNGAHAVVDVAAAWMMWPLIILGLRCVSGGWDAFTNNTA